MAVSIKQLLNAFVKTGVIYDNYTFRFKAWNQCVFAPVIEYIAIDVLLKVIQGKQHLFIQSTNDVGSFFTLPVMAIDTGFAYRCIAIRTNSFSLKATFIHVYNGIALNHIITQMIEILSSFYRTGLWMF